MRYRCPFCYYTITVDDMSRGYPVVCAGCGKSVQIPPGKFDPGCIIGDFVILEKIGAGSIGSVYKATQLSLDRQVALKILLPEYSSGSGIEDFLREARAAAKLSHTNLVQALAVGEEDGICYMAMTYVNGENLKSRLRREGRLPVDEALHIVQQVAEALYYAWDEAGLIHRDVKPDNIMTTDDGIIKLTDLGLAIKQNECSEHMEISGSPSYMSPEQFTGEKLDPRSDIYSLGVTLYQLISGRLPFDGTTVKKLAMQHMEEEPVPLRRLVPGVPVTVEALVKKMMAKKSENRFASMEELLKAIWTIRQKTAPNKSLVPDVHTISIKRLDYDMQNESSEIKAKVSQHYSAQNLLMDRFITSAGTALTVIVLMLMLWAIFAMDHEEEPLKTYERVVYFEKLSSDKSLDMKSVLEEGRKILDELPYGSSSEQKYNRQRMEALLAGLELKIAKDEILKLQQNARTLARKNTSENSQVSALKRKIRNLEAQLKGMSDYPALKRKAGDLKAKDAEIAVRKKEIAQQKKTEAYLRAELLKRKRNSLRMEIFTLQRNYEFGAVRELILAEQRKNHALSAWLRKKEEANDILMQIYALMTDSGSKFAGFPIGTHGNITMISGGLVDYKNAYGDFFQKSWMEFSPQVWSKLLQMDSSWKERPKEAASACEFLLGAYGAACKANPQDRELDDTVAQYAAGQIRFLQYANLADPAQSRTKGLKLLEQLRGTRNFPQYEKMLKPLVKGGIL